MPLPDDLDHDRLAEAARAILALTAHSAADTSRARGRAWTGTSWTSCTGGDGSKTR